jgi:hypothetical protein
MGDCWYFAGPPPLRSELGQNLGANTPAEEARLEKATREQHPGGGDNSDGDAVPSSNARDSMDSQDCDGGQGGNGGETDTDEEENKGSDDESIAGDSGSEGEGGNNGDEEIESEYWKFDINDDDEWEHAPLVETRECALRGLLYWSFKHLISYDGMHTIPGVLKDTVLRTLADMRWSNAV